MACGTPLAAPQRRAGARSGRSSRSSSPTSSASPAAPSGSTRRTCARSSRPYYARLRAELERFGGTVEKFIGDAVDGRLRRAGRARGRPRARRSRRARDPRLGLDRGTGDGLHVRIGVTPARRSSRSARGSRAGRGWSPATSSTRPPGCRRPRRSNGILVGEQTYRRDRATRSSTASASRSRRRERRSRSRVGGDRPRRRARRRHRQREPRAARRPRATSSHSARRARRRAARTRAAARHARRRPRHRQEPARLASCQRRASAGPELVTWRQGRSLPYGDGVAFWALGEMVKAQAGILETRLAPTRPRRKLREAVERIVDDGRGAHWVERHLRPLVGLGGGGRRRGDRRSEAFAAWRRFFEALAEQRPLVLVFEDLHWADDGLLDFVDQLVDWVSGVPLLVVATARPELLERRPGWGGGKPNARDDLAVPALGGARRARLAGQRCSSRPSCRPRSRRRCSRAPAATRSTPRSTCAWSRERGARAASDLPETVQGIIAARLDTLPPTEKAARPGRGGRSARSSGSARWPRSTGAAALRRSKSSCTRSSARSSCGASGARRSRARPSTPSATCWSATSPTAQIPRAGRAEKHRRAAEWIEALGRPRGPRRAARPPLFERARVRARGRPGRGAARGTRASCSARGGRPRLRPLRLGGSGAVLRRGARAVARRRSGPRDAALPLRPGGLAARRERAWCPDPGGGARRPLCVRRARAGRDGRGRARRTRTGSAELRIGRASICGARRS